MHDPIRPLPVERLRWRCDPAALGFESTAEVEPIPGIVGQPLALDALRFGLETHAPGQNIFVRGLAGTGRMAMVQRLLAELKPRSAQGCDHCYVHHFAQPDRPRLLSLPAGQARIFRAQVAAIARAIASDLPETLGTETMQAAIGAVQDETQREIHAATQLLQAELEEVGLSLGQVRTAQGPQMTIFPVVQGQPASPEQLESLAQQGVVTGEQRTAIIDSIGRFAARLPELNRTIAKIQQRGGARLDEVHGRAVRAFLQAATEGVRAEHDTPAVRAFLDELVEDAVEQVRAHGEVQAPGERYGVNVVLERVVGGERPLVFERSPTVANLLGAVETQWTPSGAAGGDYRGIRGGSLLQADRGYLILDAGDVLSEPGAWRILMRTLRSGMLEIVPPELSQPLAPITLKPEPIPIRVRVILLGNAAIYHQLEQLDRDFSDQFKVLADFDTEIDRGADALAQYAGVLSRIAREEDLPHFSSDAVAALAEHGARIAARAGKLTTRFGRLADIAREAGLLAGQRGATVVTGADVTGAVRRTKARASLPSQRFQSFIQSGTIQVETSGSVVGQVNGLAVMTAGPLTYGFPARITAAIGPGRGGIIDIESRSDMSGAIHTKGFHILGGLLHNLLGASHPLTFSASLAFEQSYGGIDGDSASGAEICCLLSALTEIPIRQSLAMTGAIDQHGHILSIGGVNEKIEGFFDICRFFGLTGEQGVIIPAANAGDLMLRQDVVDACARGEFAVHAVTRIHEALEILTGVEAGERSAGGYPQGSILGRAVQRAERFWRETIRLPDVPPRSAVAFNEGEET